MTTTIERVPANRLAEVIALLDACGLPEAGLREHGTVVLAARDDGRTVGCAALEVYDDVALLRSVAVAAPYRGTGLGKRLTAAASEAARRHQVRRLYLLTETAEPFFRALGFDAVAREDAPTAIRQTVEFRSACPASAAVMVMDLAAALQPAPPNGGGHGHG